MIKREVGWGRAQVKRESDTQFRLEMWSICDELESMIPLVIKTINAAFANPLDAIAKSEQDKTLARVRELIDYLHKLLPHVKPLEQTGS